MRVPEGAAVDIELASSPGFAATGVVLPTIDRLATILPLVAIATALLVIVLAHRRARALAVVGLAIAVAGAICLGLVWFGGETAAAAKITGQPDPRALDVRRLSADLVTQSLVLSRRRRRPGPPRDGRGGVDAYRPIRSMTVPIPCPTPMHIVARP